MDLTSNFSGNSASCIIFNLASGGIHILSIPAGSSSIVSGDVYSPAPYKASITASIQGVTYIGEDLSATITNSDIVFPFDLVPLVP